MKSGVGEFYDLRGRLTAEEINSFSEDSSKTALNATAANAYIPIIYGTAPTEGLIAAFGEDSPLELRVVVIWCMGEVFSIDKAFINGVDIEGENNIIARHYRGTDYQSTDTFVDDVIAAYSDDLILSKPAGNIGICYSVFRVEPNHLGSAPRFQAIISGKLVNDPSNTDGQGCTIGDPFYSDVGFACTFDAASPNTTITDDSQYGHTVTLAGSAYVDGALQLDGNGDYATIPDHASIEVGSDRATIEVRATPTSVSGSDDLLCKGTDTAGSRCFQLTRNGTGLEYKVSADGTNWLINKTVNSAFSNGAETVIEVDFTGDTIWLWVDGVQKDIDRPDSTLFNISNDWYIGAREGDTTNSWLGSINAVRITVGNYRYGFCHSVTGSPFSDSGTFEAGRVFSDNPANCFAELASNPYYGLAATVTGQSDAADWCDELVSGNERARLSLVVRQSKKTWEWLDQIVNYGDCLWFNDGTGVKIIADRPVGLINPTGLEEMANPEFSPDTTVSPIRDTSWTITGGWMWNPAIDGFYLHGAQSPNVSGSLSQLHADAEVGAEYVVSVLVILLSVGSIDVKYEGTTIIANKTAAGLYAATVIPTTSSPSPVVEVVSSDSNAWIYSISVKRKYFLNDIFVENSLSLDGISSNDTPTRVGIRYKESSATDVNWNEKAEFYQLPGVDTGALPLIETVVSMPGVYRQEEASLKAEARCLRMQNRVRVRWTTSDIGVLYQRGTVVQVRNTNRSVDILVLIDSVTMVSYGRFQVSGLRYDEQHYPAELSSGLGVIPVGLITLNSTGTIPTGWAQWGSAEGAYGKYIKAWSEATSPHEVPGDTGGDATYAGFSGNTSTDGGHGETGNTLFNILKYQPKSGNPSGDVTSDDPTEYGDHLHTHSTGVIDADLYRREAVFMKKTGTTDTDFPASAMVFGLSGLAIANLVRDLSYQNRLLMVAAANANDGLATLSVPVTTGTADDSHDHVTISSQPRTISTDFSNPVAESQSGGGVHDHDVTLTVARSIKRYKLALYTGSGEFTVDTGVICLWEGALTGSPEPFPGWFVCDGTNGTPDLRDHFIEIAATGAEGSSAGDNTISISGTTDSVSHDHDINASVVNNPVREVAHSNNVVHSHTISDSDTFIPEHYVLYFIMYKET